MSFKQVKFFGDVPDGDLGLLEVDGGLMSGRLAVIYQRAIEILHPISDSGMRAILALADEGLSVGLQDKKIPVHVIGENTARHLTLDDLRQVDPISVLPLVAEMLAEYEWGLVDEAGEQPTQQILSCHVYAAFAVAQVASAIANVARVNAHGMSAAEAIGFARSSDPRTPVYRFHYERAERLAMQDRANTRWNLDPSQDIKKAAKAEWDIWKRDPSKYRYPRDFRREIVRRYPEAVDGTLKNWMSKWGKSPSKRNRQ